MKKLYILFLTFFIYAQSFALFIWTGAVDTDWNNSGNWSGNVVPSSLDDVTINGGATFYPVIISNITCNSLTLSSGAALIINAGTFNVTALSDINGILTISGGAAYDADGNFDATGGVIDFTGAGILDLASIVNSLGTLDNTLGTVIYSGTTQSVLGDNYHNLHITSAGVKTVIGSLDVDGELITSIIPNCVLDLDTHSLNLSGDLTVGAEGGLDASDPACDVIFEGTTLFNHAGSLSFPGPVSIPPYFYDVTLNVGNVTLNSEMQVGGALTLFSGYIHSDSTNKITLKEAGVINGGHASSHVIGPMDIETGSTSVYEVPIGDGVNYRPIYITPSATTFTVYTTEFYNTTYVSTICGLPINHIGIESWWDIDRSSGGADCYIGINWDGTSGVDVPADIILCHYNTASSEWENIGSTLTASNGGGSASNADGRVTSISPHSDFSPFNLGSGSCNNPLNSSMSTIVVNFTQTAPTCNGDCDATATAVPVGGTPIYMYAWGAAAGAQTTATATGLCAGTYAVTVTDVTGCSTNSNVTITDPAPPPVYAGADMFVCEGSTVILSGTGALSFTWDNGVVNGQPFLPPPPVGSTTTYTVIGIDANGCTATDMVDVTLNALPTVNAGTNMIICPGEDVTLTASGAFVYDWDNGVDNGVPFIQATGSVDYIVNGIDANGCSDLDTIIVNVLPDLEVDFQITEPLCDSTNGSVIATVLNPSGSNYYFHWSNGDLDFTADSLEAGPVNLMISDDNQCHYYDVVLLGNSNGPIVNINNVLDETCPGANDGEIELIINTSNPPYNVSWLCGGNSEYITNLPPGLYQYTVTDQSDCISSGFAHVLSPDSLILNSINTVLPTCNLSDGSIDIAVSGGTGTPNYLWSSNVGFQSGNSVSSLAADVYSVIITDGNGCVIEENILLNNSSSMVLDLAGVVGPTCGNTGDIFVNVSGGNTPYDFLWNDGTTYMNISGISAGNYILKVTDFTGCISFLEQDLLSNEPYNPGICMVTVDSLSENNVLVWEKPPTVGNISHYNIYRECCLDGVANYLTSVFYDSLSQFIDTICYPQTTNWGYQLGVVDTCGVESIKSTFHRSIHLTSSLLPSNSIDLYWNQYVGFPYNKHYIYRNHPATGLVLIDSVDYLVTSYNDANPLFPILQNTYLIEVLPPSTCTSSKAVDHNTTRSNMGIIGNGGGNPQIIYNNNNGLIKIYPNPTQNVLNIELEQIELPCTITLKDLQGRVVYSAEANSQKLELDLSSYESGIYLIGITNDNFFRELKVVRQ